MYYQHRLFMGACCISCEVLYLSVRSTSPALCYWHVCLPSKKHHHARGVKELNNLFDLKDGVNLL